LHSVQELELAWQTRERPSISALVTSFNVERYLGACLKSLCWCDSILVVDSFSTDATLEIARSFDKVRVLQHPYYGGAAQKNWSLGQIDSEWVLIFDSDEVCTPELRREIQELLLSEPDADLYRIHRRVFLLGGRVRFSGCRNDHVARLFKTALHRYQDRRVHARIPGEDQASALANSMDHFMAESIAEFVESTGRYAYWGAAQAYGDGRRGSWLEMLVRPTYRFLRTYFLQLGFLDGRRGLVFTLVQACGSFQKAVTLLGWGLNERRGVRPTDLPPFEDGYEKMVAGSPPRSGAGGWSRRPSSAAAAIESVAVNE
jgi:glycosyltransferase involved in cell wall biosynthesis